ncbi:MAG: hypothetical protein ACI9X4_000659 [Glaciecola sp.]
MPERAYIGFVVLANRTEYGICAVLTLAPSSDPRLPKSQPDGTLGSPNSPQKIVMKTKHILISGLALATPFLLSMDPRGDSVTFAPAEGSSISKTFTLTHGFELDDMAMLMNGNDMGMEMEMNVQSSQTITVADTYSKMDGATPTMLTRTYSDGAMELITESAVSAMGTDQNNDATGEGGSHLNDLTVIFSWDEEKEEYNKAFGEESEGEAEWLTDLHEDMDLRGFLPVGEVSVDDEWIADSNVLIPTFAPGGNLQWDVIMDGEESAGGPDAEMMSNLGGMLEDAIEGEVKCKYVGKKEMDGVEYLTIEITINIDTVTDMIEAVQAGMAEQDIPEGVEIEVSRMDMELHMEGKGTLMWNAKAGVVHSFSYAGESAMVMDMDMDINAMGNEMENSMHMEMSGEMSLEITTSK